MGDELFDAVCRLGVIGRRLQVSERIRAGLPLCKADHEVVESLIELTPMPH